MNAERLMLLVDDLENCVEAHEWDFGNWCKNDLKEHAAGKFPADCGTVGCALNRCRKVWPDEWTRNLVTGYPSIIEYRNARTSTVDTPIGPLDSAVKFFDISMTEAIILFTSTPKWAHWELEHKIFIHLRQAGLKLLGPMSPPGDVAHNIRIFIQHRASLRGLDI